MICGVYAVLGGYLIAAARKPSEYRSLISFTIWSSVVHAGRMAVHSIDDEHERGHLIGDVPGLLLIAAVALVSLAKETTGAGHDIATASRPITAWADLH